MSTGRERRRKGFRGSVRSAMTSFAGIMTSLAAIATAVATVLGLYAHQQAAQLQQIRVTVTQQQQQIKQLRNGVTATASSPPTVSPNPATSGGGGLPAGARYLSALSPTVNNSLVSTGQQVIAAQQYTNSIFFGCAGPSGDQPDEAYDVSGSAVFAAVVGIPDNATGATGVIATVTFTNEAGQRVGQPVQVSLGRPAKVRLNIASVTQLGITCVGRDARSGQTANNFQVTLGNAQVF